MALVKFVKRFLPESYDLKRYAQDVYEEFFYLINVVGIGDGINLSGQTPKPVAAVGAAGDGLQASKWNHEHKGISSWAISGGTLFYGAAAVKEGTNITLAMASGVVTITAAGGGLSLSDATPAAVAAAGAAGSGGDASRHDHAHKGVASFAIDGGTLWYGAVAVAEGSNISLSATAGVITINAIGDFGLSDNNPQPVADTAVAGTGTLASRDDHVHRSQVVGTGGELIINVSGSWTTLTGTGADIVYNDGSGYGNLSSPGAGDFILHCTDDVLNYVAA